MSTHKYFVEVRIGDYICRSLRFSDYTSVIDYLSNLYDVLPVKEVIVKTVEFSSKKL